MTEELEVLKCQDSKTDPELSYLIPKYIFMRGTRNLLDMGLVSPQMRKSARSQDKIGSKRLMEDGISEEFFGLQSVYLVPKTHRINGGILGKTGYIQDPTHNS